MGNGTVAVLEPTYRGYVGSTTDALILFEACLTGILHHVPRRPHDRERSQLVRSGSVFIYEENASGIKRWTDGVTWSPSRILGNFLVYRELDKPFPPGEKKRAMKKGTRRPTQPTRAGEPYPRPAQPHQQQSPQQPQQQQPESNGTDYPSSAPSSAVAGPGERSHQSEIERALVGSLVDSYGFKESGLVKKTMSVTVSGVTHHLVSYYSVEDVMRGVLPTPSMVESLRFIRPRPELTTKQSFRAPVDDLEQTVDDTDPSHALYGYRPTMQGQPYGMPPPPPGGAYYTSLAPTAAYQPHPQQQLSGYPVAPPGMAPHHAPNPYMQSPTGPPAPSASPTKVEEYSPTAYRQQPPSASADIPTKIEDYSSAYRPPPPQQSPAYAHPRFDPMSHAGMAHMPAVSAAGGPLQQQPQQQQQTPTGFWRR
jgi:hypothetical protein